MDLGWFVSALAVLAGLTSTAAFVGLGLQRGRLSRLETANDDLRKEIDDEKRRHATTREDAARSAAEVKAQSLELADLRAKVTTMTEVVHGVTGPLAAVVTAVEHNAELISSHHKEAMAGLDYMYALQVDAMRLLGDTRHPARIKAELMAKERAADATGEDPA